MASKLTAEEFIEKAKLVHGDKYDYSLAKYKTTDTKLKIICSKHGIFEQTPYKHLNGQGCPKCVGKYTDTKCFIEKAKKMHGDKYDYSLTNYINAITKIKIICLTHGVFEQMPSGHLSGHGCSKCAGKFMNTKYFIEKAKKTHGDKYDYSKINYINAKIKIKIICNEHGIFEQTPDSHLRGAGCPKCAGININYLSFEEVREFARSLNLKSKEEWVKYCKSGNKPDNIPSNPYQVYKKLL